MGSIVNQFMEWLLRVLEHWELIIGSGALAFILDLVDKFFGWKMPKKAYAIFVGIGLFLATFAAWRDEHLKVLAEMSYVESYVEPAYSPGGIPSELAIANKCLLESGGRGSSVWCNSEEQPLSATQR